MATYRFKDSSFVKLADDFDDLLPDELKSWEVLSELYAELGFRPWEEVAGTYECHVRSGAPEDAAVERAWQPEIRWLFVVEIIEDTFDVVLIENSLPDYLAFLAAVEPMVRRNRALGAEIKEELQRRAQA